MEAERDVVLPCADELDFQRRESLGKLPFFGVLQILIGLSLIILIAEPAGEGERPGRHGLDVLILAVVLAFVGTYSAALG